MKALSRGLALALVFVWVFLVGLGALAPGAQAQQGDVFTDPPQNYPLVQGWYQGRATYYYDFGSNSPVLNDGQSVGTSPIYVLITGMNAAGEPQVVPDQRNIIDTVPGDPGYSDLWRVNFVTVPADYEANTFQSAEDVLQSGFPIEETDTLVNCPVVPLNSTLAEGAPGLTMGWYRGQEVHYFDFGPNPATTAPIYAFITGMGPDGEPLFVEGQHNVIDVIPDDPGYSDFWDVNLVVVPAGYEVNSITSAAQVRESGFEMLHPGIVVNCPVVRTDAAMAAAQTPAAPTTLPTTGGAEIWWLAVAGALLLGAGLYLRRTRANHRAG